MIVQVDVNEDELLRECSIEDLERMLCKKLGRNDARVHLPELLALLERAYYKMRGSDLPQEMRDYFYKVLGKVC